MTAEQINNRYSNQPAARTRHVTVRFTPAEYGLLERAIQQVDYIPLNGSRNISEFVRATVLMRASRLVDKGITTEIRNEEETLG